MKTMQNRLGVIMVLVLSLLLAACNGTTTTEAPSDVDEPVESTAEPTDEPTDEPMPSAETDTYDKSVSADIVLDPAVTTDADTLDISSKIYATLPQLASTVVPSDDGLDYIVTLRADGVFSDGTPITADAIEANFNRWFDPASDLRGDGEYKAWQDNFFGFRGEEDADGKPVSIFDGIEKEDNLTVILHLNEPYDENENTSADLMTVLANPAFSIINPDVLSSAGSSYGTSVDTIGSSGDYTVVEWTNEGLVLQWTSVFLEGGSDTLLLVPFE